MIDKKKEIRGTKALMSYMRKNYAKNIGIPQKGFDAKSNRVIRKTFKSYLFKDDLHDIEFRSVKFFDCDFEGIWGFYCIFQKCEFHNCGFRNCRFSHLEMDWNAVYFNKCYLRNVELDEGCIFNLTFDNSTLISCTFSDMNPTENIRFYTCTLDNSHFESLYYGEGVIDRNDEFIDLLFQDCEVNLTDFHSINFRNSRFYDTNLYKAGFVDCELDNESFVTTAMPKFESYATIDFQTILKSDELNSAILRTYFNVKNPVSLKEVISNLTSAKVFSTVFISYSFNDSLFATKIVDLLNKVGIRTFMWEKDAPGGERLDEIMTSGITAHDKLLFIASKNSIRSAACQYELTTARRKQEALWENVFFPITIDNYLFMVKKNQIRPIEMANEYWSNIEEIKRVNALDFSKFNGQSYDEKEFKLQFDKIVDGLKLGTP